MAAEINLRERLRVFLEAGLLERVPTPWQVRQGELEMLLYVISTDATEEARYKGAPLGHPWLRQPIIFSLVGRDHLRTGSGLENKLDSLCTHLHFTYHDGMPVFDLQLIQTHPEGLARLRRKTMELLEGSSDGAKGRRRLLSLILPKPEAYLRRFLGSEGWIVRAEGLDYPTPLAEGAALPREFYSLVGFLDYCAANFPEREADVPFLTRPVHLARLVTRRLREGKAMGWFGRGQRSGGRAFEAQRPA